MYTSVCIVWFGLVLWHVNNCRLFNAKFSLYTYIKYMIWFGWALWHVNNCRLMPNPLYTSYQICMIWFGWLLWHINHCWLFNAKSSLYIHIEYIWFGLVGFGGISTIVGYLMPNPLYTSYQIYMIWFGLAWFGLAWFGFMAYQPL